MKKVKKSGARHLHLMLKKIYKFLSYKKTHFESVFSVTLTQSGNRLIVTAQLVLYLFLLLFRLYQLSPVLLLAAPEHLFRTIQLSIVRRFVR